MALSDMKKITSSTKTYIVCKGDTLSQIAEQCKAVGMSGYANTNPNTTGVQQIQKLNPDIKDPDLIYVGQDILLRVDSGESGRKETTTKAQTATITAFGLQAKNEADASSRTVFATWAWSKGNTDHYEVKWLYSTGDGVAFIGSKTNETEKQSIYNAPENALYVKFQVRPISKTKKSGDNDVHIWTAGWSTVKTYDFKNNPPSKPSDPTDSDIKIDAYKMTVTLNNISEELNATHIQIQVWENDKIYRNGSVKISNGKVSYNCTCEAGRNYKVRYRSVRGSSYSDWTNFSSEYSTIPAGTEGIYSLYMMSSTSVNISWYDDTTAESYEVQYTKQRELFDTGNSGVTSVTVGGETDSSGKSRTPNANTIITGLETGSEYFFRVRSVNKKGMAAWSEIVSIGIGGIPSAPTTWSSRTTVAVGDKLTLYWIHNTEGGSRQTEAKLKLTAGGNTPVIYDIIFGTSNSTNADTTKVVSIPNFTLSDGVEIKVLMAYSNTLVPTPEENICLNVNGTGVIPIKLSGSNTYYWDANSLVTFSYNQSESCWYLIDCSAEGSATSYNIDTSEYPTGTILKWMVQTAGVVTNQNGYVYGEWSVERTVEIHAQPTLALSITDVNGDSFTQLTSLPFTITAVAEPAVQKPISYVVSIVANDSYETVDNIGNPQTIKAGEEVYYQYIDTSTNPLTVTISANNVNLENNVSYTVNCTVAMDSGLTGAATSEPFTVAWEDDELWPDAEITYDKDTFTTLIKPYCMDTLTGQLIENVMLSVYRREFDGGYTELATELDNMEGTYITDPHPSLDYARYRIVAVNKSTGRVSYYDMPGYPIQEKAIIIQWDEQWTNFDALPIDDDVNSYSLESPPWTGSLLRLPYNVDVSDQHASEVELVKYIGRKRPVSYYGTQTELTSTWKFEIEKTDAETLYGLRRLASWMGDVYVREASGSGYWANISVSYDIEHKGVTIPVTFDITRVEGGK